MSRKIIYKNDEITIYVEKKGRVQKAIPSRVVRHKSSQKRIVSAGRSR